MSACIILSAVAIFSNQHIISFDGSYAYLPALKDNVGCTYLLSRDFRNGLFTILVRNGQLQMFIGKASIFLSRNGDVSIPDCYLIVNHAQIVLHINQLNILFELSPIDSRIGIVPTYPPLVLEENFNNCQFYECYT